MINNFPNFPQEFRRLKIIFYMFGVISILFFLISFLIKEISSITFSIDLIRLFQIIFPLIILVSIITSKNLYKKKVNSYNKNESIYNKFISYRRNNIIKWSFLETAKIFTALAYFFTGYLLYAVLFLLLIPIFLINGASEEKFIIEYELSSEEKNLVKKV